MVWAIIQGALTAFTAIAIPVAVIVWSMIIWDWYKTRRKGRDLDARERLVETAWRAITVEHQRMDAERELRRTAARAMEGMFAQTSADLRRKVNACKLNHPSTYGKSNRRHNDARP